MSYLSVFKRALHKLKRKPAYIQLEDVNSTVIINKTKKVTMLPMKTVGYVPLDVLRKQLRRK